MANTRRDAVRQIMAEVFRIDPSTIADNSAYGMIEQWDSQNHVRLLLALEEEFDVSFEITEIEAMIDLEKIISVLDKKLGS